MTKEERKKVVELSEEGKTTTEISKIMGISLGTVSSFVSRENRKRICPGCGKRFLPKRTNQIYCSAKCRQHYWNTHLDRVNKKAFYTKTCKHCGKEFTVYGDDSRKYCSYECYWAERYGNLTK